MALEQDRKYPGKHNKPCLCPGLKATVKIQPPNTWQLLLMIKLWGHHRATLGKMLFGSVSLPLTHCLCLFIPSFCTSVIKKKGQILLLVINKHISICVFPYISKKPPQNWLRCTAHRNDKRREQLCHSEADLICHPCTWFSGLWEKPVSLKVITHQVFSYFTLWATQDAIYLPLHPEWMYYHAHKYQHILSHEAYVQACVGARAPLKHR